MIQTVIEFNNGFLFSIFVCTFAFEMIKKLYWLIFKSFVGPFFVTFCIALFVLMLNFLLKYLEDFVGKGLPTTVILELLTYAMASFVVYALPMAILLSSLMTFGNLGEHYELVAMKSAGISLPRIMTPMILVNLGLAIGLFFFSNYAIPKANLNFYSLLYDITQAKPAFQLNAGVFYTGIKDVSLRANEIDNESNILKGVLIYDHTSNLGANKIITAESGKMEFTQDKNYLVMTLYHGWLHEERLPDEKAKYQPHNTTQFSTFVVLFDVSSLQLNRTDKKLFLYSERMKNTKQLAKMWDSISKTIVERKKSALNYYKPYFHWDSAWAKTTPKPSDLDTKRVIEWFSKDKQNMIYRNAFNSAQNIKDYTLGYKNDVGDDQRRVYKAQLEYHLKYALSAICVVFLFIGAPLGAIIRKGGLGLPTVVSIIFFITYWMISEYGKKIAQKGIVSALHGAWLGVYILLPISIIVIYLATTDANIMDVSYYKTFLSKFSKRKSNPKD